VNPASARRLLVFARDPVPGAVKTRLIPALGTTAATAIYRRLLEDTLACAAQVAPRQCELWVDRLAGDSPLHRLAVAHHVALRLQAGADLGARMLLALQRALARPACAVLIGSDCPGYSAAYLHAAFAALTRERLRGLGWNWQELPTLTDVDRPADVGRFAHLAALAPAPAVPLNGGQRR
jgi:hypothetical protein